MIRIFIVLGIVLILGGCGRKTTHSIIYQDVLKTNYDTILSLIDGGTDTIYSAVPCDSFTMVIRKTDTIYIRKVHRETQIKLVTKHDTIIRQPIIVSNGKTVVKTDNSVTAKKGSIIGNDNTMTTKKNNWWWIFLCGMLVMFIIQNVGFRVLKTYFPFLKFLP